MAENNQENFMQLKTSARTESSEEKELRLKMLREKQIEERQRKLEELKAQAMAAQHFREMKEQERRKRLDELKVKENDRRQQVGERKRLICEAERDRRESILRKNQERELRFEMKKRNERGSLSFAFGSSTPRMLEPADTGGSFWGYRRATSTSNILFSAMPLTRRSSERELDGSKKRATSAGGLERNSSESNEEIIPAGCASGHMGRRRTDLMPTIPLRDSSTTLTKRPFTKSPGRTYSMSRLDQLAKPRKPCITTNDLPCVMEHLPKFDNPKNPLKSCSSNKSMSRSMSHLTISKILNKTDSRSMHQLLVTTAVIPRTTRATQLRKYVMEQSEGPSRPGSSLSQQSTGSVSSTANVKTRSTATRKPRPVSIAITGVTHDATKNESQKKNDIKPPIPKPKKNSEKEISRSPPLQSPSTDLSVTEKNVEKETVKQMREENLLNDTYKKDSNLLDNKNIDGAYVTDKIEVFSGELQDNIEVVKEEERNSLEKLQHQDDLEEKMEPVHAQIVSDEKAETLEKPSVEQENISDVTSVAKIRITTEEEAKAALAERRRLAREEAERQALLEKLRIEEEEERQRQEEEQLQRLAEEQRKAEEERLAEAIKEAQKREEEERIRKQEELKQKLEKEEQERKAREENEKKKIEMEERLKIEGSEREARRKRVEAIMLRTRAKGSSASQKNDNEKNDLSDENKTDIVNNEPVRKTYEKSLIESQKTLFNGALKSQWPIIQKNDEDCKKSNCSNGHESGANNAENLKKDNYSLVDECNVTNSLLTLNEFDSFRNTNTNVDLSTNKITIEDNVNSNNPKESGETRSTCEKDLLL